MNFCAKFDENDENLSKNLKTIVKNIESMNTSTYDYITAAEEEYKLNGKILNSNIYSTMLAYLDASYFYLMTNFDKKKDYYDNSFELHGTLKELDGEIIKNQIDEKKIKRSKWCSLYIETKTNVENEKEKSTFNEIQNGILNFNDSIEIVRSKPNQVSPIQTFKWTNVVTLLNISNITKHSNKNVSKTIIKPVKLDPIGTKPKSMSIISSNKNNVKKTKSIEKDIPNQSIWSNGDSSMTPIFNYNIPPQSPQASSKYKVSKFFDTLVKEFSQKNFNSNRFTNQKAIKSNNQSSNYCIRSCHDYNQSKYIGGLLNQENMKQESINPRGTFLKSSRMNQEILRNNPNKYKFRRNYNNHV